MFSHINNITYPKELFDILLELYNKIKEKFKFINNNTEIFAIDNSLDNIDLILEIINKLTDMLEMNPLFKDEYYISLSIISYIEFIIADKELLKQSTIFIANIVINFFNLINDKQDFLLSKTNINYKREYEEFMVFYNNQKRYFHTHIYKGSEGRYNDAVDKVTNLLW